MAMKNVIKIITFDLIESAIGFLFILLLSYFEFKFKK